MYIVFNVSTTHEFFFVFVAMRGYYYHGEFMLGLGDARVVPLMLSCFRVAGHYKQTLSSVQEETLPLCILDLANLHLISTFMIKEFRHDSLLKFGSSFSDSTNNGTAFFKAPHSQQTVIERSCLMRQ
ncbi:hypothetical protein VNO78_08162 [Psophocarpus tetragonolobus]|uniref:Uncharacterized protein n=1 Tax=Psophocarpus tetragonolobus TaxID=3891 RepID=A0AAN9SXD0_PSOTE